MLCNTIVLRHVSSCNFVLNAVLIELVLNVLSHILTPSIRVEGLHFIACLQFSLSNKSFEHFANLRFCLKG